MKCWNATMQKCEISSALMHLALMHSSNGKNMHATGCMFSKEGIGAATENYSFATAYFQVCEGGGLPIYTFLASQTLHTLSVTSLTLTESQASTSQLASCCTIDFAVLLCRREWRCEVRDLWQQRHRHLLFAHYCFFLYITIGHIDIGVKTVPIPTHCREHELTDGQQTDV